MRWRFAQEMGCWSALLREFSLLVQGQHAPEDGSVFFVFSCSARGGALVSIPIRIAVSISRGGGWKNCLRRGARSGTLLALSASMEVGFF